MGELIPESCPHCGKPATGLYDMNRPCCRVRLVKSARPSRKQQESMLEYIRFAWGVGVEQQTRADLVAEKPETEPQA